MSRNGIIRWSFTSARTHSNRSYSAPPSKKPQQSPLEGIKVLDLSRILAGPSAAQLLGDLGAEVIKIEEPGRGDDTRWLQTQHEQKQEPQVFKPSSTLSNYFISCNRNKKSLTLNLKKPDGIRILRKLVAKSDVFR
ncbi:hypothetical protein MJO29_002894 [Puccinia striiformis f. sp. tritici]|nr:hypothetical protein MJO29_002894 [Puccinia striiformis f. sp. tritici]